MKKSILSKDRFVRKVKHDTTNPLGTIIVKRLPRYGYYCDLGNHKRCVNSYIDCSCNCHNEI